MWVEPDLNMPDGESLVRQLLVGKRWYKQAYGVDVRIGWNPDSFGYTWQLPQIYKKSGVDYFVTQKMTWNDTNQLPFKLFWWESPDGSKVLTYFPHDYVNLNMKPDRLSEDLKVARERSPGMLEMMDLYGIGDHGGGPTRAMLDVASHWAEPGHVTPKYEFGTAQSFFASIEKQIAPDSPTWNYQSIAKGYTAPAAVAGKVAIPTWNSEMYLEYHRGVYTTQANHKRNMRDAEEQVLNAEKWASLAWLDGREYPGKELTEDWKKVLFNQFHDLAAGSGIGVIYKDAQKDYDVVRWSTNEIDAGALETIAAGVDTHTKEGTTIPILVFNPLGWERSGYVSARVPGSKGESVFSVIGENDSSADHLTPLVQSTKWDVEPGVAEITFHVNRVPAFGYKVVQIRVAPAPTSGRVWVRATPSGGQSADSIVVHNSILSVRVNKSTGCITSLFDLRTQVESLASGACGNQLQFFKDTPKDYDAWNIDPGTLDEAPATSGKTDDVYDLINAGGAPAIRIVRHWQSRNSCKRSAFPMARMSSTSRTTSIGTRGMCC